MTKVFIDTELWSFALKKPQKKDNSALIKRYNDAKSFLTERIQNDRIFISSHQLSELFHVLSFRGKKLSINFTVNYIEKLMKLENISVVKNNILHFKNAMKASKNSGIHIWDFLCVIPILNQIELIYSCDSHFNSKYFQNFKKPIYNPLDTWICL